MMDDRYNSDDGSIDKQWASNYILGPLYDPEPSQVCATRAGHVKALPPTPPDSSPTRPSLGFSRHSRQFSFSRSPRAIPDPDDQPFFRRVLSRTNSVNHHKPLPPSPPQYRPPKVSTLERKKSVHTSRPPQTRWNQGTILSRANSVASSRPTAEAVTSTATPPTVDKGKAVRRTGSLAERYPGDRSHRPLEILTRDHMAKEDTNDMPLRRGGSLRERYPGDMSHRPLAMLARDYRAADRVPHLRNPRKKQPADPIDALDHTGPVPDVTYHHSGPYDPTMKSRNVNKMYSPVEAVKDTNLEALKATPAIFLKDSLDKHVPLQGTAVVPPGERDMSGRRMDYREGADLMRERDAAGGPYKQWEGIHYRDDDYKGKGDPSLTAEKAEKEKAAARRIAGMSSSNDGDVFYEMQPQSRNNYTTATDSKGSGSTTTRVRQRSTSNASPLDPFSDQNNNIENFTSSSSSGMRRSNTTGKSLTQTIKRRLGSLRKRRAVGDGEGYYQ